MLEKSIEHRQVVASDLFYLFYRWSGTVHNGDLHFDVRAPFGVQGFIELTVDRLEALRDTEIDLLMCTFQAREEFLSYICQAASGALMSQTIRGLSVAFSLEDIEYDSQELVLLLRTLDGNVMVTST